MDKPIAFGLCVQVGDIDNLVLGKVYPIYSFYESDGLSFVLVTVDNNPTSELYSKFKYKFKILNKDVAEILYAKQKV